QQFAYGDYYLLQVRREEQGRALRRGSARSQDTQSGHERRLQIRRNFFGGDLPFLQKVTQPGAGGQAKSLPHARRAQIGINQDRLRPTLRGNNRQIGRDSRPVFICRSSSYQERMKMRRGWLLVSGLLLLILPVKTNIRKQGIERLGIGG